MTNNTQTQPVLATEIPGHAGMLFVGGDSGHVYGYDALTRKLLAANHPIPDTIYNNGKSNDLDVQGTPLVLAPNGSGCGTMIVLQGKSGERTLYDENQLSRGFAAQTSSHLRTPHHRWRLGFHSR